MIATQIGVLAGGRGRRMGGRDKALLCTHEGETILSRLERVAAQAQLSLVVAGGPPRTGLRVVPDDPSGIGPLGGLRALLIDAGSRPILVLGCDMPYVTAELLARLAQRAGDAAVLAPRDAETGKWQPMFARYDPLRALPSLDAALRAGVRSFQTWFCSHGSQHVQEFVLALDEHALLRDWDAPSDITPQ